MTLAAGAAVWLPYSTPFGVSTMTRMAIFGSSTGATPIKEPYTSVSEYPPASGLLAVPVFPPIRYPGIFAVPPPPSETTDSMMVRMSAQVWDDTGRREISGSYSSTGSCENLLTSKYLLSQQS